MEKVSIRDYIDQRFADHRNHVDERFDQLEMKVEANRKHGHPGFVTWAALMAILIPLASLTIALVSFLLG